MRGYENRGREVDFAEQNRIRWCFAPRRGYLWARRVYGFDGRFRTGVRIRTAACGGLWLEIRAMRFWHADCCAYGEQASSGLSRLSRLSRETRELREWTGSCRIRAGNGCTRVHPYIAGTINNENQ